MALSFFSISNEKFEDITQRVKSEHAEDAASGINIFWWIAFFVSLGLWYALIEAAMWAGQVVINWFS